MHPENKIFFIYFFFKSIQFNKNKLKVNRTSKLGPNFCNVISDALAAYRPIHLIRSVHP